LPRLRIGRLAFPAGIGASGLFLLSATARSLGAGRLPFASMYEFGLLFILALQAIWLAFELARKPAVYRLVLLPFNFVLAGVMLLFFQESRPLMPALQSAWLFIHVLTAVLAYGLFAVGAVLAVAWLIKPDDDGLWRTMDRLVSLGFPFLSLLIVSGAVWAQYAWGSFWRWDPKETWSLITWLVYLIYLHGARVRRWRPRSCAWFAILGFVAVLFTFFGVNLLLSGLHSYT
ncbi:MAG: hypothetical protein A2004_06630, partial [Spirochaetes bacterium GWC1_61_12]